MNIKWIGFYNPDEKFLLRGTDWVFKQNSLRFVCKRLTLNLLAPTTVGARINP